MPVKTNLKKFVEIINKIRSNVILELNFDFESVIYLKDQKPPLVFRIK